jgi:hypothetical protein
VSESIKAKITFHYSLPYPPTDTHAGSRAGGIARGAAHTGSVARGIVRGAAPAGSRALLRADLAADTGPAPGEELGALLTLGPELGALLTLGLRAGGTVHIRPGTGR